jgi:hypothetical protein
MSDGELRIFVQRGLADFRSFVDALRPQFRTFAAACKSHSRSRVPSLHEGGQHLHHAVAAQSADCR